MANCSILTYEGCHPIKLPRIVLDPEGDCVVAIIQVQPRNNEFTVATPYRGYASDRLPVLLAGTDSGGDVTQASLGVFGAIDVKEKLRPSHLKIPRLGHREN